MKFSEQWLREWVNPAVDSKVLVEQLTMLGLEVDTIEPAAGEFSGVVIGQVISAEPHPDAERLHCCLVDIGEKSPLTIVCGGINVRAGLRVPIAKIGAVLPGNFKIKKAKLRDVFSHGMICSSNELGLGEGPKGEIMELRADAPIGNDFREYLKLNDYMIDVELTPNRGDCACIRGIARDLAVLNRMDINSHHTKPQAPVIDDEFPVTLEAMNACPRYVGRVIRNINSDAVTPLWLEERLRRSGFRTIHPVVDILNYVMLEIGQPMHAFDLDQLNKSITVRYPRKGEKLILLDEQEIELHAQNLIIADTVGPLALAGVMGGLHSGVTASTQNIFLEAAFFDPIVIRQSAKLHSLRTDSSYRFERGVDHDLPVSAIERATELLLSIVGGEVGPVTQRVSETNLPKQKIITFRSQEVRRLLGIAVEDGEVERILMALGMDLRPATGGWVVAIPSYRYDLEQEADLVEEVARIYGYNNIPVMSMLFDGLMPSKPEAHISRSRIADYLVDRGYSEAITYSFISKELSSMFDPEAKVLTLLNPIASDMSVMRSSLWPGLIQAIKYNQYRQMPRVRLFEMGLTFHQEKEECRQIPKLAIVSAGSAYPEQWAAEKRSVDFYDLKGEVEVLLAQTRNTKFHWESGHHPALHPGQTAVLYSDTQRVGYLGALHPKLMESLDLQAGLYCFEVDLSAVQTGHIPIYEKISKFPLIRRDIAIVVSQNIPVGEIKASVIKNSGQLLSGIDVFDVYQGENLGKDKKSVALGLTFQDPSRTLVDSEINDVIQDVVEVLERDFNAKLRT